MMLLQYAQEHGLTVIDEYVDDGWSGTNYDRPSFQRMIDDIEDGKINCVVTKDLSRLGRNYADAYKRYAFEEAEHAAKFAELLGEVVTDSTKKNLELRVAAEHGACAGKKELATLAKELGLDAVHDTVHEMAKDEARHGCGFNGLLKRYFGK